MASAKVSIVHDELGHIKSIARPSEGANVMVLSGDGESVFVTEVEEEVVSELVNSHRVDISQDSLVEY